MKKRTLHPRGEGVAFALSWLAMSAVVTVLNALPPREAPHDELPGASRNRPTPPANFRR